MVVTTESNVWESNVWDSGRWRLQGNVRIDFMTRYIMEQVLAHVSIGDKTLLELGAGTGRLSYLALLLGAKRVVLVDSSTRAIALARQFFSAMPSGTYEIIHQDIHHVSPDLGQDIVLSSGTVEHFRGDARQNVIQKHMALAKSDCLIVHPSDTAYAKIFNIFPISVWLYGYQKAFSACELEQWSKLSPRVISIKHKRFQPFYTVPFLHNFEFANRWFDKQKWSAAYGGLTLSHVRLGPTSALC